MKRILKWLRLFFSRAWAVLTFSRRFIGNLLFLALIVLVLSWFLRERGAKLPERAILDLSPVGVIVEQRSESLLSNDLFGQDVMAETPLKDIIDAIEHARDDQRIKGIFLDLSKLHGAGLSKLRYIGSELTRFRESGKPVIAAADFYIQRNYYLAAHADRVYLHPMGGVLLTGFGAYRNYFKSALDKLLVNVHVFKAGRYKSALEPFTRNDMSDFDKKANSALLDVYWESYKSDVAGQRGIEAAAIDDYVNMFPALLADSSGDTAKLAMSYRLVDALKTQDQLREELVELAGEDPSLHSFNRIRFDDYIRSVRAPAVDQNKSPNQVGVIVAQGIILEGVQSAGRIGGDSLSALIRQASSDEAVRALVLRIDSPGGSAFASDEIRSELERVRMSGKPVVVSMGSTAASGGYWIATAADEIWASPTTVTGSIGVFGAFPTFEKTMDALGIYNDGVGTTRMADAFNSSRPMNPLLADAMTQIVENSYRNFIEKVAAGRKMAPETVEKIAEGRIWVGKDAQAIGLVDHLGEFPEAIESAAKRAGLDQFSIHYFEPTLTPRERLLKQLNDLLLALGRRLLEAIWPQAGHVLGSVRSLSDNDMPMLNDPNGVYAYCLGCGEF